MLGQACDNGLGHSVDQIEPLKVIGPFAMAKGNHEKRGLPRLVIVKPAIGDRVHRQTTGLDVLCKGSGRVAP